MSSLVDYSPIGAVDGTAGGEGSVERLCSRVPETAIIWGSQSIKTHKITHLRDAVIKCRDQIAKSE